MVTKENFEKLINHRLSKFDEMVRRGITLETFANKNYQFIRQYRLKPIPKAHDKDSLIYNYVYWMIHIERKISIERQLIEASLNNLISSESTSRDKLVNLIRFYKKRRNQAVQRLIGEAELKVKTAKLIFDDIVEIEFYSGKNEETLPFLFYCNKNILDKYENIEITYGLTQHQEYVNLINLDISLDIQKSQNISNI